MVRWRRHGACCRGRPVLAGIIRQAVAGEDNYDNNDDDDGDGDDGDGDDDGDRMSGGQMIDPVWSDYPYFKGKDTGYVFSERLFTKWRANFLYIKIH